MMWTTLNAAPRRAEAIWDDFLPKIQGIPTPDRPLKIGEGVSLFQQSIRAYDAGSYDLAALGCRAALESACYLFLTRGWVSEGVWAINLPRSVGGDVRQVGFAELIIAIKKAEILDSGQLESLERIQAHGNLIAHYASKSDKQEVTFVRALLRKGFENVSESEREMEAGLSPLQALEDLEDTGAILIELARASLKG
jgi:hypothetical protein